MTHAIKLIKITINWRLFFSLSFTIFLIFRNWFRILFDEKKTPVNSKKRRETVEYQMKQTSRMNAKIQNTMLVCCLRCVYFAFTWILFKISMVSGIPIRPMTMVTADVT